jgi:hypothetical protein
MKKIIILLILLPFCAAADWIKIGSFGLHSDYLYRGASPTHHQPALAPELSFLHSEMPLLIDFWFLSSLGKNPYGQLDLMLSGDLFQKGKNLISLTALGKAVEIYTEEDYAFEILAAVSRSGQIPLMAEISYEFLQKRSYLQIQSAFDFDYKLPWTLGILGGRYLFEKAGTLTGFSLASYLQVGKFSIEPYSVLQLRIHNGEKPALLGSLSLTLGFEF